jgi:hypothetical protein
VNYRLQNTYELPNRWQTGSRRLSGKGQCSVSFLKAYLNHIAALFENLMHKGLQDSQLSFLIRSAAGVEIEARGHQFASASFRIASLGLIPPTIWSQPCSRDKFAIRWRVRRVLVVQRNFGRPLLDPRQCSKKDHKRFVLLHHL